MWSPGPYPAHTCTELWRSDVTSRIKALEAAQAQFEGLIAQLQAGGVVPPPRAPVAESGSSAAASHPRGTSGDTLELDLGLEVEADEDDAEDADMPLDNIPQEYSGVLEAVHRLKNELPARLAQNDAWAPGNVGRLWES